MTPADIYKTADECRQEVQKIIQERYNMMLFIGLKDGTIIVRNGREVKAITTGAYITIEYHNGEHDIFKAEDISTLLILK